MVEGLYIKNAFGLYIILWSAISGISVARDLPATPDLPGTPPPQAASSPACFPHPLSVLWRVVRQEDVGQLELMMSLHPFDVGARLPCLHNQTLLHQAAGHGSHKAVTWLLDRGANLEDRDSEGRTPLMEAARGGQGKCVRLLLERGADPRAVGQDGRTALHLGAGYHRVVEKLLRRPESKALLSAVDHQGDTPLHRAAVAGSDQAVRLLLRAGANVNLTNTAGESPLHLALLHRRLKAAGALLEGGADPNAPLADGRLPLHIAVEGNGEAAVRLLVGRGARPDLAQGRAPSPLAIAKQMGRDKLAEIMSTTQ